MKFKAFLYALLVVALIGFTSCADPTGLATDATPTEQHASDHSDKGGGSGHIPKPATGKPTMPPCPIACVAVAAATPQTLPVRRTEGSEVNMVPSPAMVGASERPPTPPPRYKRHRNIN
jgi:hypothetical protein